MTAIGLDRQFIAWDDKNPSDIEVYERFGGSRYCFDWSEILKKHRVVILAEAGSGKTFELKEQVKSLSAQSKRAFYATVQDVAREGLPAAFASASRSNFAGWDNSGEPAWFFVDSVDEAKLDGILFERALQRLADGIYVAPDRAHVIISCRHSDWEFRGDFAKLTEILPLPHAKARPPPPTAEELLRSTLRGERRKQKAEETERPSVVLMASLDRERIDRFACASGIARVDEFMRAIDSANLWRFARRPLDLQWLVAHWRTNNTFGPLSEMLETSLMERLREQNLKYSRTDKLEAERAISALERIGASFVFGRTDKLRIPDAALAWDHGSDFDLAEILPDWSSEDRQRLLTRAVFDPGTFGRIRLHNDNEGTVRSYLAARWLARRKGNASARDVLALLFANT
jgi:hypothetical protein